MFARSNSLFRLDARQLGEVIGRPVVDVIVTSPPYADLKDYGVKGQIGYGQDYEREYIPSLKDVFRQCYNVCKNTGSLWVIVDTFKKDGEVRLLPFDIIGICREIGWTLSDIIIWEKGKTLPWSHKGRFRNMFEYILFFAKSPEHKYYDDRIKDPTGLKEWWVKYPERYSFGGKNPSNVWHIPIPVQGSWAPNGFRHLCPFPPELVERILLLTSDPGDLILDPFSGSGVVLAQSLIMNRKFIGFEINSNYVNGFRKKVLPSIKSHRKGSQQEMKILESRRQEFEKSIGLLRILKYPKALVKALNKRTPSLVSNISAIAVRRLRASALRPNKYAKVEVTFLVRNSKGMKRMKHELEEIAVRPPVSKYGIEPEFHFVKPSEYRANGNIRKWIYIYTGGRTYFYKEMIRQSEFVDWIASANKRRTKKFHIPPIVSDEGVRQQIIKTWREEE